MTGRPDLAALLANPTGAAQVPLDQVPALLEALDAEQAGRTTLRALLVARLTPPAPAVAAAVDDDDLLTDEDVGRMLSVPGSCVTDLRKAGELPGRPVGEKYIRTRRGDVRAYVARLPNVTYSRRHDRRGGGGASQAARSHPGRAG